MTKYLSLVKVFLRSLKMNKSGKKSQRVTINLLLFLVVLFIFIPFLFICMYFVMFMTHKLAEYDYQTIGLEMALMLVCICSFIFSFSVILNEFYFSENVENLLPLPVRPYKIVAAKFTSTFFAENVMLVGVILFSTLGFFFAEKIGLVNLLVSLIGILTIPIVPMIYCALISVIIMSFTKFIKNKESVRNIGSMFLILIVIVSILLVVNLRNFNLDVWIENFVNGDQGFLEVLRIIFPHINLFINSLNNASIIDMLEYILVNIAYIVVFLFVGEKLYYRGVIDLSSKNTSGLKKAHDEYKNIKQKSKLKSYFMKEVYTLLRTPSYMINCVVINFLWPLFVYLIYVFTSNASLTDIRNLVSGNNSDNTLIIILLYVVGVSTLVPAISSIASSSFSREGKHFSFIKYIPYSYKEQIVAKFLVSFVFSFLGINVLGLILYIAFGIPFVYILSFILISLLCISIVSALGILIDSVYPKIVWDDELSALRENTNNFLVMGIAIFIFTILIIAGFILYKKTYSFNSILTIGLISLLIITILVILLLVTKGPKNIEEMEDI